MTARSVAEAAGRSIRFSAGLTRWMNMGFSDGQAAMVKHTVEDMVDGAGKRKQTESGGEV